MRPMLACPAPTEGIEFPVYASPKVDGVRCVIESARAKTRKLELIPNEYVQQRLGWAALEGLDGELTVGAPYAEDVFNATQRGVLRGDGVPDFMFHVFDYWNGPEGQPYSERHKVLSASVPALQHPNIVLLDQWWISSVGELTDCQAHCLELGYEGLIVRSPGSPYKHGRSTAKQGWMMKVKKFTAGTARIVGTVEMLTNANDATLNELGQTKRSKAKAGMVPAGVLDSLAVVDNDTGVAFNIGSGFDAAERAELWKIRDTLPGQYVEYTHFEIGVKTAPRFPIYKALRHSLDVGDPA